MKYSARVSFELSVPVDFESAAHNRNVLDQAAKSAALALIEERGFEAFNVDSGYIVAIERRKDG